MRMSCATWLSTMEAQGLLTPLVGRPCEMALQVVDDGSLQDVDTRDFYSMMDGAAPWIMRQGCPACEQRHFTHCFTLEQAADQSVSSEPSVVRQLLKAAWSIAPADIFLDLGAGDGLPMEVAEDFPYGIVGGIEIDRRHLQPSVTIMDAAEYVMSEYPHHLFAFNPFDNATLRRFLSANILAIEESGSLVCYNNTYRADHVLRSFGLVPLWSAGLLAVYGKDSAISGKSTLLREVSP